MIGVTPDNLAGATETTFGDRAATGELAEEGAVVGDDPALHADIAAASEHDSAAMRRARTPCIDRLP
jgi:hypothetical protein